MKAMLPGLLVFMAVGVIRLAAQPYAVTGQPLSGGGLLRGGRFQVAGSIGQPEAGPRLTGDCWSIDPGFWGAEAPGQPPDGLLLHVRHLDFNYVRVSFKPGCGNWVLQWTRTLSLEPAELVWTDEPSNNLMVVGDELVRDYHVPSWGPWLFFRLVRP